ncbi:MAG: CYTH domain-containing protein [Phocaeicola sp.]
MGQEIERKFLVLNSSYKEKAHACSRIMQGYISHTNGNTVRVRVRGEKAYLTIKGKSNESGLSRYEWEKEIAISEAYELLKLCGEGIIDKKRYLVHSGKHLFEIDEFYGNNEGLVVAEIELTHEEEYYEKPDFIGEEVTGEARYYNVNLMTRPYCCWDK